MSIRKLITKAFMGGWSSAEVGVTAMTMTMLTTSILVLYLALVYRLVTRNTLYSKRFHVPLAGVALISATVVLIVHADIKVFLSLLVAVTIVRFRTAVRDAVDLMFLFWAVSIGVICGAGMAKAAILLSLVLTVGVLIVNRLSVARSSTILMVRVSGPEREEEILESVSRHCRHPRVKARSSAPDGLNLTLKVRTDDGGALVRELIRCPGVRSVSLLSQDGETAF